jgi:hypothetical protein
LRRSPGGAICFHSNFVLVAFVLSLTPGPSPEVRGVQQELFIAACVRLAFCFVLENLHLILPPTIEIVGLGTPSSTKSRDAAVIRHP